MTEKKFESKISSTGGQVKKKSSTPSAPLLSARKLTFHTKPLDDIPNFGLLSLKEEGPAPEDKQTNSLLSLENNTPKSPQKNSFTILEKLKQATRQEMIKTTSVPTSVPASSRFTFITNTMEDTLENKISESPYPLSLLTTNSSSKRRLTLEDNRKRKRDEFETLAQQYAANSQVQPITDEPEEPYFSPNLS